eukprot:g15448.t1
MNELRLSGPFSVIAYRSTFVGTQLYGRYSKGSAIFRSDSITTISVLKDIISKEATAKKIQVQMHVDVNEETFGRFLELVHPKLNYQHALTQQVRMVEPLREVQLQEGETNVLHQVHSVEIIFCSGGPARAELPEELSEQTALPSKESSQESLEETQETWLQPLLRNIFGNLTVSVDNLVAKFVRNGAVACVKLGEGDAASGALSRPRGGSADAAGAKGFGALAELVGRALREENMRTKAIRYFDGTTLLLETTLVAMLPDVVTMVGTEGEAEFLEEPDFTIRRLGDTVRPLGDDV